MLARIFSFGRFDVSVRSDSHEFKSQSSPRFSLEIVEGEWFEESYLSSIDLHLFINGVCSFDLGFGYRRQDACKPLNSNVGN